MTIVSENRNERNDGYIAENEYRVELQSRSVGSKQHDLEIRSRTDSVCCRSSLSNVLHARRAKV